MVRFVFNNCILLCAIALLMLAVGRAASAQETVSVELREAPGNLFALGSQVVR